MKLDWIKAGFTFGVLHNMKFETPRLLTDIEAYVKKNFANADTSKLLYHNYTHTQNVVEHTKEIADHYSLGQETEFVLLAAAWFHDTGHLFNEWEGHEEKSVEVAEFFLSDKGLTDQMLKEIRRCIMATKMPAHPTDLMEAIICDADTYHLGTDLFFQHNELVWDEIEARLGKKIVNRVAKTVLFMEAHKFFTSYCRELLQAKKEKNLEKLRSVL
ncbi:MAG: metal-dependent phosphohydrolase [Citrobacter freundii]|nr:MAG: metal-dependent phosphohydrolase [Citrobacter freundii]